MAEYLNLCHHPERKPWERWGLHQFSYERHAEDWETLWDRIRAVVEDGDDLSRIGDGAERETTVPMVLGLGCGEEVTVPAVNIPIRDTIARKRDGLELGSTEIAAAVSDYTSGSVSDAQMAALLMAIVLRDMSLREITDLTLAMADSGIHPDLSRVARPTVDKHSTGGVGDKTTLVVAPPWPPWVSACRRCPAARWGIPAAPSTRSNACRASRLLSQRLASASRRRR